MKLCVTRHWLELANQWLEATRRFLWLDSDSTRASHDSDSTWKNFRWLWLDENDSDTSLPTRKTFFFSLKRRDNDITIERPISKRAVLSRGSNDNWLSSLIRSEVMVAQRFASHLWKMLVKRALCAYYWPKYACMILLMSRLVNLVLHGTCLDV